MYSIYNLTHNIFVLKAFMLCLNINAPFPLKV